MTDRYVLVDGEERSAKCPGTFIIPTLEARTSVRVGDFVKVGAGWKFDAAGGTAPPDSPLRDAFLTETGVPARIVKAENFWVRVIGRTETDGVVSYLGKVDDRLLFAPEHGLRFGDAIGFGPRHVLTVMKRRSRRDR